MWKKYTLLLLLFLANNALWVTAPRKIVVYDAETKVPIRKVWVWADTQTCNSTNYLGHTTIPNKFDTLIVIKARYMPLRIPYRMVGDSIAMIKNEKMLGEVVIYGKDMRAQLNNTVRGWLRADAGNRALLDPSHGIGFNFFDIFDFKSKKQQKRRKRMLKSFEKMDKQDEDPIIRQYKETLKAQQQKK